MALSISRVAPLALLALAAPAAAQAPSPFAPMRKGPGLVVAEITIRDAAGYRDYASRVTSIVAQYGGRFLVRGGRSEASEGAAPAPRVVIIQFPSLERAHAFITGPEYQAIAPQRRRFAETRLFLVEGAAP